ncbi:MAG: DUF3426 domain-containing protein [Brachymonas sp.]
MPSTTRFVSRCPDCGTSFWIVADQLRIAQGWVRCGHCQTVYQAQNTLSAVQEETGDAAIHLDGTPASSGPVADHGEEKAKGPVVKASPMERIAAIIAARKAQTRMARGQTGAGTAAETEPEPDNPAIHHQPPPAEALVPVEFEEAAAHIVSAPDPEAMGTAIVDDAADEANVSAPASDLAHSFVPEPPEPDEGDAAHPSEPASEPEQAVPFEPAELDQGGDTKQLETAFELEQTRQPEPEVPNEGDDAEPTEPPAFESEQIRLSESVEPDEDGGPESLDAPSEPEQTYPSEAVEPDESKEAEPPDSEADTPEEIPSEPAEELPPLIPAFLLVEKNAPEEQGGGSNGRVDDADDAAENDAASESEPEAESAVLVAMAEDPVTQAAVPVQTADAAEAGEEEKFSFVRDAERRAFWCKPLVRVGLSLSVGLGMLVLAGQWVYHQRSSLYARIPLARLALDAVCKPLNCRIAPWQNIHAVEIETSEFLKNADSSYALHVALRNNSPHPVVMPALELSLLDADQQLVAKRVIAADPAVPVPPILPPRGQWDVEATVDVHLPADVVRYDISGYRLTIFYP